MSSVGNRTQRFWRTVRFRLLLWGAGAVFLTAVVTLLGLRHGVRWALVHELDQVLVDDLAEIAAAVDATPPPSLDELRDGVSRKARTHRQHSWFAQFLDAQGREIWSTLEDTPGPARAAALPLTPETQGELRVVERSLNASHLPIQAVRVGSSLQSIEADIARIDRLVMIAVGIVLLVAPLAGYALASRAIAPVAGIIATAERLRPNRLDERLPLRGTDDELDRLSQTINGLLDRIARYIEQKRDFLANSAHELRAPLAAIRSSIEVALMTNRSVEEYQQLLADVIEESTSLEMLVNQLLLLSETEAERFRVEKEPVAFHELVARCADMFEAAAEAAGLSLVMEELTAVTVAGNPQHLRQLVNNLLDNAIKFTPPPGRIGISLGFDEVASQVHLRVTDTGIGIPDKDLPRIFERFFRGDRAHVRDGAARGTGLGLSICQAIVAGHGGSILIESQATRGATFEVTLPATGTVFVDCTRSGAAAAPA